MRWIVSLSIILAGALAACGGPQVPTHNGYKPKEVAPWKKPKVLKFDDKMEAKAKGDVSYPDMRRARWFELTLPSNGQLALTIDITPPGDAVNDDFDLGFEVFNPQQKVIAKSELEDEDAHEQNKKKTLVDLAPGKYLVHLFLQGRMDTAEFELHAAFKPTAGAEVGKSNFPADVLFVPVLPMVPLQDDTPRSYKPPTTTVVRTTRHAPRQTPTTPPPPAGGTPINARIIDMQIVSGGTQVVFSRGLSTGASDGMKATLSGVSGSFPIGNCKERTCSAVLKATPDQIRAANSMATLTPP